MGTGGVLVGDVGVVVVVVLDVVVVEVVVVVVGVDVGVGVGVGVGTGGVVVGTETGVDCVLSDDESLGPNGSWRALCAYVGGGVISCSSNSKRGTSAKNSSEHATTSKARHRVALFILSNL